MGDAADAVPDLPAIATRPAMDGALRSAISQAIVRIHAEHYGKGATQAKTYASNYFNLSSVTVVAVLFVLITIPQTRFVDRLLERDAKRLRSVS